MKLNKQFILLVILCVVYIGGTAYLVFNDYGIIKYNKVQAQVDSLAIEIQKLKDENLRLQGEIDSLENKVPAKIETIAREKYDMKKPGETIIEIEEK